MAGFAGKASGGAGGRGGAGGLGGTDGSAGEAGETGDGGLAGGGGAAGAEAGAGGEGGQASQSLYCRGRDRGVLYLLDAAGVLARVDADTLEPLGEVQVGLSSLNSLAVTHAGVVYITSGLDLYRVHPLTGLATNVNLDVSGFVGEASMTIGFSPSDPVLVGDTLLVAHAGADGDIDLHAVPPTSFVPQLRHHFAGLREYPEPLVDSAGRTFLMLSPGFVEYDSETFAELGTLEVPDLPGSWSGDSAYLSGYLFAAYALNPNTSRIYRAPIMPAIEDSPLELLGTLPTRIIGAGAACEDGP